MRTSILKPPDIVLNQPELLLEQLYQALDQLDAVRADIAGAHMAACINALIEQFNLEQTTAKMD